MWRDVSGTVGGGGSNGRWTVVSSDRYPQCCLDDKTNRRWYIDYYFFYFQDPYDSYIILSFVNGTLVLSISETIEEVQDTSFLSATSTLAVQKIGANALLQVHPQGIHHVLVTVA